MDVLFPLGSRKRWLPNSRDGEISDRERQQRTHEVNTWVHVTLNALTTTNTLMRTWKKKTCPTSLESRRKARGRFVLLLHPRGVVDDAPTIRLEGPMIITEVWIVDCRFRSDKISCGDNVSFIEVSVVPLGVHVLLLSLPSRVN